MAKQRLKPHRGHAWCSCEGICVPQQLDDSFRAQLGEKVTEFDLFAWYQKRTVERKAEMIVVGDVWTTWREEFQTELAFRGWYKPKVRPMKDATPIQSERLQRLGQTMGRTADETRKHFEQYRAYKNTHHNSE